MLDQFVRTGQSANPIQGSENDIASAVTRPKDSYRAELTNKEAFEYSLAMSFTLPLKITLS